MMRELENNILNVFRMSLFWGGYGFYSILHSSFIEKKIFLERITKWGFNRKVHFSFEKRERERVDILVSVSCEVSFTFHLLTWKIEHGF